jgi:hypothetical protein
MAELHHAGRGGLVACTIVGAPVQRKAGIDGGRAAP